MEDKSASNLAEVTDMKKPTDFPPLTKSEGKIVSAEDKGGSSETLANLGVSANPATSKGGKSWGKAPGGKKGKPSKAKQPPKSHTPTIAPTSGPMGYLADCDKLEDGELQAAYPSEYLSFKKRKEYATTTPGWLWAKEWTKFRDFLRDMGPKPAPHYTLERKANANKAYGPGLCIWLDKTGQNNNKSDNVNIVVPLTGEVFKVKKIAELHKVQPTTVYGWRDKGWSDIEMLFGTKAPHLAAFIAKLKELPSPSPKNAKLPSRKADWSSLKKPDDATHWAKVDIELWDGCDRDSGGDEGETRKLYAELMAQRAQEYADLIEWGKRYNAGLPCSPQPPQGRFYRGRIPDPKAPSPASLPKSSGDAVSDNHEDDDLDGVCDQDEVSDQSFDPADCLDPADYGHFSDDDDGP